MSVLLLLAACSEEMEYLQEDYASVVYMKDEGQIDINFYNIGQDMTYNTQIRKGGTNVDLTGEVELNVWTKEDLIKYNTERGTHYELLPPSFYTLPEKVHFTAKQEAAPIAIVLHKDIGDLDGDYVLPVVLKSDAHRVNLTKNTLILHINIIVPTVSLEHTGTQKLSMAIADDPIVFKTNLLFDYFNEWEFTVDLVTSEQRLQQEVDKYNVDRSAEGIVYKLLPLESYEMPKSVAFSSTSSSKELAVLIKESMALKEGDYILPLILDKVNGKPFDVSSQVFYIHVAYKDVLPYLNILLNNPNDNIVTASGYDQISGNNYMPFRVFDNAPSWVWQTHANKAGSNGNSVAEPYNDPVYGQYLDINVRNAGFTLSKKLDVQLQSKWSDFKPHVIRIYGKEDGSSSWVPLTEELTIGDRLRKPTALEDNGIGTNINQTFYRYGEVEKKSIDLGGKSIVAIRVAVLKTYKGRTWAEQTGIFDQKVKPIGTTNWPAVAISELKLFGK